MLHLTDTQTWLILVGSCTAFTLVVWAVFVVIPNRNETIRFLKDRNQTLEYWVNHIDLEKNHSPFLMNLRGTDAQKNLDSLIAERAWLVTCLGKCQERIDYCNQAIIKEKNISNEPQ